VLNAIDLHIKMDDKETKEGILRDIIIVKTVYPDVVMLLGDHLYKYDISTLLKGFHETGNYIFYVGSYAYMLGHHRNAYNYNNGHYVEAIRQLILDRRGE